MEINQQIRKHSQILKKLNNYNKLHLYNNKLIDFKNLLKLRLNKIDIIEKECQKYLKLSVDEIINNDNLSLTILIDNLIVEMPDELQLENNIYNLLFESLSILMKIMKIIKHNIFYYILPTLIKIKN